MNPVLELAGSAAGTVFKESHQGGTAGHLKLCNLFDTRPHLKNRRELAVIPVLAPRRISGRHLFNTPSFAPVGEVNEETIGGTIRVVGRRSLKTSSTQNCGGLLRLSRTSSKNHKIKHA